LSARRVRLRVDSAHAARAALALALGLAAACESDSLDADLQASAAMPDASTSPMRMAGRAEDGGRADAGSNASPGDSAHEDAGTAESGGAGGSDAATFTSLYQTAFWTCKSEVCHGIGLAGLDMSSQDAAHASLVRVPAADAGGMCGEMNRVRVVPGEPDESLLYLKLSSDAPCGQQMPPGGQLSADVREQVRRWIELGAPND
jgi:hypothetical protein